MGGLGSRERRNHERHMKREAESEISQRHSWRRRAQQQRVCQHPDCTTPVAPWDGHHVVYEQEVVRRGHPKYDDRNVLRLCKDCHRRHHNGIAPIPLSVLKPQHIEYAKEVLGDFYIDYLNRRYVPECPI